MSLLLAFSLSADFLSSGSENHFFKSFEEVSRITGKSEHIQQINFPGKEGFFRKISGELGSFFILKAQEIPIPTVDLNIRPARNRRDVALSLELLFLITILTLAPSILVALTSFVRIATVLLFVRQAIGTQQIPPTTVLISLSLFLTFFTMAPTINEIKNDAVTPYFDGKITFAQALKNSEKHIREFMFSQTREKDIGLFLKVSHMKRPKTREDVPTYVLIPAFMISELKTAFQIGMLIYIPFLVIDMIVASVLLSMGMMMLPPAMVSLPFKLLVFVAMDGWNLIVYGLINSFK